MSIQNTSTGPEISLADVSSKIRAHYRYLKSRWVTLGVFVFIGCTLGVAYAWWQKPLYPAVLTFSLEDDKSSSGIAGLAAQFGLDVGGSSNAFSGDNIMPLLESNRMVESTLLSVDTFDNKPELLLNRYLYISGLQEGFSKSPDRNFKELTFTATQSQSSFTRLQDSVLLLATTAMQKGILKINKPDSRLNLYSVTCESEDEAFSVSVCTQLIKQLSDFYVDTKTKHSAQIVDVLQKRADSIKLAYDNALLGKAQLSDANINPAFQTPEVNILRKQTDITVFATAYGELLKNLEIAKFNLLKETPLIQIVDEPATPIKKVKLGRLMGGLIGGFILGLLCVAFLTIKRASAKITS